MGGLDRMGGLDTYFNDIIIITHICTYMYM